MIYNTAEGPSAQHNDFDQQCAKLHIGITGVLARTVPEEHEAD